MKFSFDKLWLGLTVGLLAPMIGMFCFYLINYSYHSFIGFLRNLTMNNVLTPLLSLFVIINLGLFYLFIQTNRYYSARGVIMATMIYAFIVVLIKYVF